MLFNSYPFLFVYLPIVLLGFFLVARRSHRFAATWLAMASLVFYGYWNIAYVPLLCGSILFNYFVGRAIANAVGARRHRLAKQLVAAGIVIDLALLGYFKYASFFIVNVDAALGAGLLVPHIILPLGISFFTFTQIAYLVDVSRGVAKEYSINHYALFVSYFPHLIAGPILHHNEMIPQFRERDTYRFNYGNIAKGLMFFAMGLFKKVALADGISIYVAPVFGAAAHGSGLTFLEAWGGALAYTIQLYFDFSGYSDMAVGLSWLFNVQLPFNFNSPYKASSVIDFWRRWHMTLSRFLRDYLYIPLGGNRLGASRRYMNLFVTMLLGGLWHGASWTFVLWGALHGGYLMVNHVWHAMTHALTIRNRAVAKCARWMAHAVTLLAVIVAWVFFRATSTISAKAILSAMFGGHGISLPAGLRVALPGAVVNMLAGCDVRFGSTGALFHGPIQVIWIVALFVVCVFFPNSQQLVDMVHFASDSRRVHAGKLGFVGRVPVRVWAVALGLALAWCILRLGSVTEFLYFQF